MMLAGINSVQDYGQKPAIKVNIPLEEPSFQNETVRREGFIGVESDMYTEDAKDTEVSAKFLKETIDKANKAINAQSELRFSVHESTHAIMVKVMDKASGKVIREIPSEKMLDIAAKMMEMSGILIDQRI